MKKNIKKSYIALSLVLAILLTACGNGENSLNEEITASESVSDSTDETKPETTTAKAETSFETTAAETEASTEAATSESEWESTSESGEESVSESDSITEEQTESTSESTFATTAEAAAVITAESTEAAVYEGEQTNVSEIEAVTEEETSVSEGSVSKEMAALKTAVSLHEIHKEEEKTIDLCISPLYVSGGMAFDVGLFHPFDYEGENYLYQDYFAFISDADRNITVLGKHGDGINDIVMNFDKPEYIGMSWDVCYADDGDEADIYRYEDKLIVIYNKESYLLSTWEIRKQVYGFTDNENYNIGCDLEKLKKALSERGIKYDPSVFMFALVYAIDK